MSAGQHGPGQTIGTADNTYRDQRKSYLLPWLRATNCHNRKEWRVYWNSNARKGIRYPEMRGQKLADDCGILYTLRYWSFAAIDELACVSRHFSTDGKSLNQNPACREKEKRKSHFPAQHSAMTLTHFPDHPNGRRQTLMISTHHGHVPVINSWV